MSDSSEDDPFDVPVHFIIPGFSDFHKGFIWCVHHMKFVKIRCSGELINAFTTDFHTYDKSFTVWDR